MIKDAELFEVSVVSVPCNQAATFSLAKSFDSMEEYNDFKKTFTNRVDLAGQSLANEDERSSSVASNTPVRAGKTVQKEIVMSEDKTPEIDLEAFAKQVAEQTATNIAMKQAEQKAVEKAEAEKVEAAEAEKVAAEKDAAASRAKAATEFERLQIEKAIADSCKIKKKIVEKDEKEKNLRKILNLGHTFAHAYEASLSYSKKLNHGEAVILGIVSSAKFSFQNKILDKNDYKEILNHINSLKIPISLKNYFAKKHINPIIKYMKSDKKNNSSKINIILIKKIGKIILNLNFNELKIKKFISKELIY